MCVPSFLFNSSSNSGHLISYLLFLSRGWFSFEDACIHGLNVLYHHAKHLVAEIKHQLRGKREGFNRTRAKIKGFSH